MIGINGAAAHLIPPGDLVIVIAYALLDEADLDRFEPRVVHVDADNRLLATDSDPGTQPGRRVATT